MGQEIVYCSVCRSRLLASDFDGGKAFWVQDKPCCVQCVMDRLARLSPGAESDVLKAMVERRARPTTDTPRPAKRKTSTAHVPVVRPERRTAASPPPRTAAWVAAGAGGLLLLILVAMASRPRPPQPPPKEVVKEAAPPPPAPPPEAVSPREAAARKALDAALDFGRKNPADLPRRLALLEEAVWETRGTSSFAEARREHEKLQKERAETLAAALGPLDVLLKDAASRERFAEGLVALQAARGKLAGGDWSSALDQRVLRLRHEAEQAYAAVRDAALAARRRGDETAVKAAAERVGAWGQPELAAALARALDAVPPPAPDLPPEARAYREAWDRAMARAAARDYEGAARDLLATNAPDAAADAALLKGAGEARAEALRALAKAPKGQALSLEVEGGTRVDGAVAAVSATGIELRREGESVTVAYDDLTPRSLREILGRSDRALALLGLLEGEDADPALPPKYRQWAAARPDGSKKEAEAAELYRAAEDARADPARALEAIEIYRGLGGSHGDTLFVRRRREAIAARLAEEKDVGRDYVIPIERMSPAGGFGRTSQPKAAACWSVMADGVEGHVEFSFAARADAIYRCWVYVGACCAETFAFQWKSDGHPEPLAVAPSIPFLKKTHAQHGGPKQPARFEWVPLPLPKPAAPGPVRVRILSRQQGFSLAWALVSATRTFPPGEAVLKDWERARPPAPAAPKDAGLVALWTLDEGRGGVAADASPNGLAGTLRNDPVWAGGRRKAALSFDGANDYVEIPKSPKLVLPGPFTVAAWINVGELPSSKFGMYVVSDYRETGDRSTYSIRVLPGGQVQFFWQHEEANDWHATSSRGVAPGRWAHVAGVFDGAVRRVYLDGLPEGENAKPQPRPDLGGATAIGRPGAFNGLYFRGRIDDVRIYGRALSAAEIKALAAP